jgi:sodium-dependent phosphate transporter
VIHKSSVSPSLLPPVFNINSLSLTDTFVGPVKMVLTDYTYVFVIGTFFAMLDAFNNDASK